jgi:hypothetical protein
LQDSMYLEFGTEGAGLARDGVAGAGELKKRIA